MSVLGLGTDIVAVSRVADLLARHGSRFLARCFTAAERAHFENCKGPALVTAVAGRWAAKESFLKALGGAIQHIPYHDIGVVRQPQGAPRLVVTGRAAAALTSMGGRTVLVTISHEQQFAVATVLIED